MLKLSKYPFNAEKSAPKLSENISTKYLLQGGFIRQEIAGVFNFLPLGVKIIKNIQDIINKHINATGSLEVSMTGLGSKELREKTGRWDNVDVLFKVKGHGNTEYGLNLTHEESVTNLMKSFINSYKKLPTSIHQNQTKFRNEKRAKSGILRGREFLMHDQYSFHADKECLDDFYKQMSKVYFDIYNELGIGDTTYYTYASGGDYSDEFSHEYQTLLGVGEDVIHICKNCNVAYNKEIVHDDFVCKECGNTEFDIQKACEVGNIFKLMTNFSEKIGLYYASETGEKKPVYMGSYGIGISRTMGVIAEYFMDEKGLMWPINIAPYRYHMIVNGGEEEEKYALDLAQKIEKTGKEVIVDDRNIPFGQKASDADLLGMPDRIVVSKKSIDQGGFEVKHRGSDKKHILNNFDSNELIEGLE